MTADAPDRPVYCLGCGRRVYGVTPSLDPAHPWVYCVNSRPDGTPDGCGRRTGTYSEAEAIRVGRAGKIARATRAHDQHVAWARPSPWCERCQVDPPRPVVRPHDFEHFPNVRRVLAHLDLVHRDRSLTRFPRGRTMDEAEARHRQLHAHVAAPHR
jgi:hypothetical protein